jgi:flagellar biosynthesis/type III secretory pathway chaperone
LKKYYNNRELIHGCFGVQSVISYKFLYLLEEKYSLFSLLDIIDKGREIEELYGHYFDKIIRNTDMDKTYQELFETIINVQNENNIRHPI